MKLSPEALYLQLGRLVAEMPDFSEQGAVSTEANRWLGRAAALIDQISDQADIISFKVAAQSLDGVLRAGNAQTIKSVVFGALARAELAAPLDAQGAFIQAGGELDAFVAFGKVLGVAATGLMIVDPYADEKALTDFAIQAPEGVAVRILADAEYRKGTLKPAAERWAAQYKTLRPLEVRLAARKTLHDRLILVDGAKVWTFGQSLNAIAARAHTSIVRVDADTSALKVAAYEAIWANSAPI